MYFEPTIPVNVLQRMRLATRGQSRVTSANFWARKPPRAAPRMWILSRPSWSRSWARPWHQASCVQYTGHETERTRWPRAERAETRFMTDSGLARPRPRSPRHCLKKTSAVPAIGGRQSRGLLPVVTGPVS